MGSCAGRDYSLRSGTGVLAYGYKFSLSTRPQTLSRIQAPWSLQGSREIRSNGGRWLGLQPVVRRISDAVPSSLHSHSQRSCRPQPRGGGGDATSRQDTRQDRWLYFGFLTSLFFFRCLFEGSPSLPWGWPKNVESQAIWVLTRQSRVGDCRRHRVTEPPAGKAREACGLTSEPLVHKAGNSVEMTGFTCEEILGIQ